MRTIKDNPWHVQPLIIVSILLLNTGSALGQAPCSSESTSSVASEVGTDTAEEKRLTALKLENDNGNHEEAKTNHSQDPSDTDNEEVTPAEAQSTPLTDNGDQKEIEALKQQIASMKEDFDTRLEQLEFNEAEAVVEEELKSDFRVFGFFDLSFMWRHIGEDSFFGEGDGIVNTSPQFLLQHLNLYFSSQMTRSLSFLTELQFTFLPNGAMAGDFNESERQETTVVDPYTQQNYRLGGMIIQRAYFQWEPYQFFGVKAGYFLTPYGIWHEDHAGTVRISILPPFENDTVTPAAIAGKNPLPSNQLGLLLYGRFFPNDYLRFDYAFTVSNGRGPADTVVDYDDNKGLGLRLKLTYSNSKVEVSLGGYGYFGEYTDKYMAYWNEQLLENYKEYALATDFMVTFFGVRIQAEYVRSLTRYSDKGRPAGWYDWGIPTYAPDYVASMFYTLLAYQLPLDKWLNGMTFTPYFGVEFDRQRDELDNCKLWVLNFGLNFKPSSVVTLKVEGSRFHLNWLGDTTATIWTVAGQLAVSF